jgi:hypothetical protein
MIEEEPFHKIAQKWGITIASLHQLQESASAYAGTVVVFCSRMCWDPLKELCKQVRLGFRV